MIDQLSGTLHVAGDAMAQTDVLLFSLEGTMRQARNDVSLLGTSSAVSELMDNGRIDPEKIAEFSLRKGAAGDH